MNVPETLLYVEEDCVRIPSVVLDVCVLRAMNSCQEKKLVKVAHSYQYLGLSGFNL